MAGEPELHPVQLPYVPQLAASGRLPKAVTMRAYEVYCHCWGEQKAMVTGGCCRGGFSAGYIKSSSSKPSRAAPAATPSHGVEIAFELAPNPRPIDDEIGF